MLNSFLVSRSRYHEADYKADGEYDNPANKTATQGRESNPVDSIGVQTSNYAGGQTADECEYRRNGPDNINPATGENPGPKDDSASYVAKGVDARMGIIVIWVT